MIAATLAQLRNTRTVEKTKAQRSCHQRSPVTPKSSTMPIYFIHHPSGNVVIRTDNAYIVLWHQLRGWLTTTSFADVLHDHPEWSPAVDAPLPPRPQSTLQRHRICDILASPLYSFLALYTGIRTESAISNTPSNDVSGEGSDDAPLKSNSGPIHWMTALERGWYEERGHELPVAGWIRCAGSEEEFEYRLESGKWELKEEAPPSYALASTTADKEKER